MGNVPNKPAMQPAEQNAIARNIILGQGVDRLQQVQSISYDPSTQTIINVQPTNVGLVRGFLVKVEGTIRNTHASIALSRTGFGSSNLLRNIQFTDVNNQVRHQTQGWHLAMVNSAKQPMVWGGAYAPNVPVNYGNNYDVMTAQSSIAAVSNAPVQMYYYVPLSYARNDLRGAMWAGITNATAQLQLEINPNPVIAAPGDSGIAVYTGTTGATGQWLAGSTVKVTVWQDYIDQIPMLSDGQTPLLPMLDMQVLYQLNNTNMTGLVANQDYGVPFANFRSFLSTCMVYDNAGTYNSGTDINYFALQTANASNIWKYGPEESALFARTTFMADPPPAVYYFDHRSKPINTQQFGNTQITINPATVNTGASVWAGFEYFSQASQVVSAASLPSGG